MRHSGWILIVLLLIVPAMAVEETLQVQIAAVSGLVQTRLTPSDPWKHAEVGAMIPIGAELRTGPRSAVQFRIGDDQLVTLDRLGVVQIIDALKQDGKIKTDLGMKYGRTGFAVQEGGVEHESTIRSPSSTLAVRGSEGFLQEYAGQEPIGGSVNGHIAFVNTAGREIALDPGDRLEGRDNAASDRALVNGRIDPRDRAQIGREILLAMDHPSGAFQNRRDHLQDLFREKQNLGDVTLQFPHGVADGTMFTAMSVNVFFANAPAGAQADLDLVMQTPSGARITNNLADPHNLQLHGSDHHAVNGSNSFFNEIIFSNSSIGRIETGAYRIGIINHSNFAADLVSVNGVNFQTGGGATTQLHFLPPGGASGFIPAGKAVEFIILVPPVTAGHTRDVTGTIVK